MDPCEDKSGCLDVVVPETPIRVVADVSRGELVCGRTANNGKHSTRVGRPGTKVAQFQMVARASTLDRAHKRSISRIQAARRYQ